MDPSETRRDVLSGHAHFKPPHLWESPDGPVWRARSIDKRGRRVTVFGSSRGECEDRLRQHAEFTTLRSGELDGVLVVTLDEPLPLWAIQVFVAACRAVFGHDDGDLDPVVAQRLGVRFAVVNRALSVANQVQVTHAGP